MNPELEQVDKPFQPSIEPCLTAQDRVMDPDCDVKVSAPGAFADGSSDRLKKSGAISPGLEGTLNNEVGAVSKSWSCGLLREC